MYLHKTHIMRALLTSANVPESQVGNNAPVVNCQSEHVYKRNDLSDRGPVSEHSPLEYCLQRFECDQPVDPNPPEPRTVHSSV